VQYVFFSFVYITIKVVVLSKTLLWYGQPNINLQNKHTFVVAIMYQLGTKIKNITKHPCSKTDSMKKINLDLF